MYHEDLPHIFSIKFEYFLKENVREISVIIQLKFCIKPQTRTCENYSMCFFIWDRFHTTRRDAIHTFTHHALRLASDEVKQCLVF
jgi:hypothetical protein